MGTTRAFSRLVAIGPSLSASAGEGILGIPRRLRLPRPARLVAILLAAILLAYTVATSIPSVISAVSSTATPEPSAASRGAQGILDNLPVSFEQNVGQVDPQVRYLSHVGAATVFLTASSAVFASQHGNLTMALAGAYPSPAMTGTAKLPGIVNYFIGNDPSQWRSNVSTYHGVTARGVYPGIDLTWHGTGTNLEYDFTVAPGADPNQIAFELEGARSLSIAANGDLLVGMPDGTTMRQKVPSLYQEIDGHRRAVPGGYLLRGTSVTFRVGAYDHARPLTIDPLIWSTYLGGTGNETASGVALDAAGNVYVDGRSASITFPVPSPGAFQSTKPGSAAAFVMKINPSATAVLYATYLGGSGTADQNGSALAVDAAGNAHVFGYTSAPDFPTLHAVQPSFGGNTSDRFVAVLNAAGTGLLWSTYLGGNGTETPQTPMASGLALDGAGNTYVAGGTRSTNFPTFHALYPTIQGTQAAFVSVFNPAGAFLWSTYLGGFSQEQAVGIGVDQAGNVYIDGLATSLFPTGTQTPFPTTPGSLNPTPPCSTCQQLGFLTKFAPGGQSLAYSTFLPGSASPAIFALAVDAAGNTVVGGTTNNTSDLPLVNPLPCCTVSSTAVQGFLEEVNPSGNALLFSSGLSPGAGAPRGLVFDQTGNLYLNGNEAVPASFPALNPIQACSSTQGGDVYVMKITPATGSLDYATCLGPTSGGTVNPNGIAIDAAGNAYVAEQTNSASFPVVTPALQPTFGGSFDGTLSKISDPTVSATVADLSVTQAAAPSPATAGSPLTTTITVSNAGPNDARGAGLSDTLDPGVIFQSATSASGTCGQSARIVTCSLGTIPSGGSASVTVVAEPVTAGTVTSTVTASSADPDPNTADNSSTLATQVTGSTAADLSVTQTATPNPVTQGFPLTYALSVANNGPNDTTGATLTEALPSNVTFSGASASQGACANASGTVTCNLGTLTSGASATATVVATASAAGSAIATATVSSLVTDPNPANSTAAVTTTINPPSADLSATLTASPSPATAGSPYTYTIGVANAGPSPATGVVATDVLPAGVTFSSASSGCTNTSGTVTCNIGTINANASLTRTITVNPPSPGTLSDTASVTSTVADPNSTNNSATTTTIVNPAGSGGLPSVIVAAPAAVPLTGPAASAVNVTATCPGGTLVGGGSFLSRIDGSTPGNGLKLNGSLPSDSSGNPLAGGSTNPGTWTTVAGFGGQSDTGDQARAFALCSTSGGPTSTVVVANSVTGTATEGLPAGNPPLTTTATCPSNTRLIGGGSLGTPPSEPSFKPVASYPSDSSGNPATDGSTNPDSWTSFGSAGAPNTNQVVSVFALCSANPALNTQVARTDTAGPQTANTFTTTSVTCPSTTRLLDGGVRIDENAGNTQPQQGVHVRGTYPSDASAVQAADGSFNPTSWTNVVQAGGQNTPGINVHSFALCALAAGASPSADLSITKTASPTTPTQGASVTYTLTATNAGPSTASGATVTDTVPSGESFVSASSTQGSCSFSASTVVCAVGSLANAASATMTVVATATQAGTVTNTATVGSTTADPNPNNNSATATVTVAASADLALTKTASPTTLTQGASVTYTVTATNNGPSAASGVTVTDPLPAGETLVSSSSTQGSCSGSTTVSCTIGTLANAGSATVTIVATATQAGTVTNTATAASSTADPNSANNSATAAITVAASADLSITKTGPANAFVSIPVTYTVVATNNGPSTATGATVTDTLPASLTFSSAASTQGSCSGSTTISCALGTLSPGSTATITVVATPNATGPATNTATISANESDPNASNNSASTTTQVFPAPIGLLRVTTTPAVPTRVSVTPQGSTTPIPMDQWGLNWVHLANGTYTVSFSDVPGYETPAPQTVTVTGGNTTTVNGAFTQDGFLRVQLAPAGIEGTISIDGKPADDYGYWSYLSPGSHQVCYSLVKDFTPPTCQSATVTAGQETDVTGTYTSSPGAPFPTNFGLLRVTTSPAVPTRLMLTPQGSTTPIPMDQWGLNWVRLTPGTYTLSFSGVPGYEPPAPQTVTITAGSTTVANGAFTTDGFLRVQLSPAGADGTISVNGTPRDDFGMWDFLPPATYQVCFSPAPGYSITPSCQAATVTGNGAETDVTGTYQGASSG